jgi:hypothetical protein
MAEPEDSRLTDFREATIGVIAGGLNHRDVSDGQAAMNLFLGVMTAARVEIFGHQRDDALHDELDKALQAGMARRVN